MAHSILVKLNKAANEFQAGESVGFNVRGGVQYYDRKTKQKEWTNYTAVIFAKAPAQIDFYRSALVEGAAVELCGKQQKIDVFQGQNGAINSIELIDAWIGSIYQTAGQAPQQQAQQYQQAPQQAPQYQQAQPQQYQQPQYQQPQQPQQPQQNAMPMGDDIPF